MTSRMEDAFFSTGIPSLISACPVIKSRSILWNVVVWCGVNTNINVSFLKGTCSDTNLRPIVYKTNDDIPWATGTLFKYMERMLSLSQGHIWKSKSLMPRLNELEHVWWITYISQHKGSLPECRSVRVDLAALRRHGNSDALTKRAISRLTSKIIWVHIRDRQVMFYKLVCLPFF